MKRLRSLPLVLAFAALTFSASAADQTPPLPIDQALKIAQDYLQQHGVAGQVQITGLVIEQSTMHTTYWYAKWSAPVGDGSKKELGLRIDMDGTITRFVSAPGASTGPGTPGEPPQGQRRLGARNIHGGGG